MAAAADFKGFDEMAEEDDYIHSDGLNVKAYKSDPVSDQQQQESIQNNYNDSSNIPDAEPTWSLLDRPTSTRTTASMTPPRAASPVRSTRSISPSPQRLPAPASFKKTSKSKPADYFVSPTPPASQPAPMPYLSVVADAMEGGGGSSVSGSGRFRRSASSGYDTDNEESSNRHGYSSSSSSSSSSDDSDNDSDDDEDDPIMSQIRESKQNKKASKSKKKKRRRKKERRKKSRQRDYHNNNKQQQYHDDPSRNNSNPGGKKNPNRFMDQMDEREAAEPAGTNFVLEMQRNAMAANNNNNNNNNNNGPDGSSMSSLKNWMTSSFQRTPNKATAMAAKATSFLKLGPLSRRPLFSANSNSANNTKGDEENNFSVVSSSNVLGDDELAALAEINSQAQSPKMCSPRWLWTKGRQNPREAFIVFTMLFAVYAWFFHNE